MSKQKFTLLIMIIELGHLKNEYPFSQTNISKKAFPMLEGRVPLIKRALPDISPQRRGGRRDFSHG